MVRDQKQSQMNEHHTNVIRMKFGRTTPPTVTWRRALPRGNLFLFCVRPDRHLTSQERTAIQVFCDQQFGSDNWHMVPGEDFVGFRSLGDLTMFRQHF
jgi:hypothetical protein